MLSGMSNNTDYHALANSSYLSPAQQHKTRGFVDFDLQLFRPGLTTLNAHEKRFDPYNHFPANISSNKPVPQVDFAKGLARDNGIYRNTKLSDPLYDHGKHLNLTHRKEQGILQFAKIRHMRGDDEKRMAKLKEFQRPQDNWRTDMEALGVDTGTHGPASKDKKKTSKSATGYKPAKFMAGVDYLNTSLHFTRGIGISK